MKTPQQVAQKWATNLGSATQAIKDGVNAVTESPTAKAAANPQAFLNGVQNAVNSGKWATKLQAVSLPAWQAAMITKGVPRVATGATAAIPKMQNAMTQLLPYIQNVVSSLPPRGDKQQNIARSQAFLQGMLGFKLQ